MAYDHGAAHMVEELCFLVRHLLKDAHDELELILAHDDRLNNVWLLTLGLRATAGACTGTGERALGACTFAASFFVVLVQPVLVALIHVIDEAIGKGIGRRFLDGVGGLHICDWVFPSPGGVQLVVILNYAGTIGRRDESGGSTLLLGGARRARRLMAGGGSAEDRLQVMFLDRQSIVLSQHSAERDSHGSSQSELATPQASNNSADGEQKGEIDTHVGILSVHTCRRDNTGLLLIFIEDDGVGVDGVFDNLEASLVGDTVAISEGRLAGMCGTGHIMRRGRKPSRGGC